MSVLVSVVIATYKRPQLLTLCLDCLAKQTFDKSDFEVIVISDGRDEATEIAVKRWNADNALTVVYGSLEDKSGPAAARNFGWRLAKGSFIAFTDDDCLPDTNWLTAYYDAFKINVNHVFSGKTTVPVSNTPTDYQKNISGLTTG